MDYFYVGNHIGSVGLNDSYLKYSYSKNKLTTSAALHVFNAAAKINATAKKYLGTEFDLVVGYKLNKDAMLSLGTSFMAAGSSMTLLKGGSIDAFQSWSWLMLSVSPKFIN